MKKETIERDLSALTVKLLEMVRNSCWNKISDNCLYIISEIKDSQLRFDQEFQLKIAENKLKVPKKLADLITELEELYENFYDVNLYVYQAKKDVTIVDICYYSRLSLKPEYRKQVESNLTMLHCKVATPIYCGKFDSDNKRNGKFDIHWQFGTFNHKWRLFWYRRKMKRQLESQKVVNGG